MKRYIIIAGETSGDNYGQKLIQAIKQQENEPVEFWGIGGSQMVAAGLNSLEDANKISVVGFSEVIKKIPTLSKLLNRLALFINELNPHNIILIDFPGFNLNLAKRIKKYSKNNLHITYFISPQVCAWNERRINHIKKYINTMLVIFPFEEQYYKNKNIFSRYVGHPFLDDLKRNLYGGSKRDLGFDEKKKLIGIFPGSRSEEIKRHLPIYLDAIHQFQLNNPNIEYAVGLAPGFDRSKIEQQYDIRKINIIDNNPLLMLSCCDVALVTSGTISLEATFMNIPSIVSYRLSFISWFISKMLLKTKYISITNIMHNSMVIPELIQHNVTSKNIIKHLAKILYKDNLKIKNNLKEVQHMFLQTHNAIDSAAEYIITTNEKK